MHSDPISKCSTQSDSPEPFLIAEDAFEDYILRSSRLMALGELVAGVAHNFGNVLMCVSAALELIHIKMETQPELAPYAESIESALDRVDLATELTQRLLEFAREAPPFITDTDLKTVVDRSLSLCMAHPQAKRVALANEVPHDAPPVKADARQLEEVITNLVLNAMQASNDGRITVSMETRADDITEIRVVDQGCGIPPEDIENIFRPFFSKRRNGERGTGLGLSCCLGQVRAMGGTIEVESSPGEGSTFKILLPMQSAVSSQLSVVRTDN